MKERNNDMTKYSRFIIFPLLAAVFAFCSCSDDDEWSVGKQTNAAGINVYLPNVDGSSIALASTENSFTLTVARSTESGELTVPLKVANANGYDKDGNSLFSVPESVTFSNGEKEKTITVSCSDNMDMFKTYNLTVIIPEEYTKPYSVDADNMPRKELNIIKEDYKTVASGKYYADFWGDDNGIPYEEEATLEYSEIKKMYRVKNVIFGQTFTFSIGEDNSIEFGDSKYSTGYIHPSYGEIYISPSENEEYPSYYDPDTKKYYFGFEYTVSAGSFGDYYEWFKVAE